MIKRILSKILTMPAVSEPAARAAVPGFKRRVRCWEPLCGICLLLSTAPVLLAENSAFSSLTYQGRISVEGVPLNGSGLFKFALVGSVNDQEQVLWNNDGSVGSENPPKLKSPPTASVTVPVVGGQYAVALGGNGMVPVSPDRIAVAVGVKLRVWFNDGVHGFEQIGGDISLHSVPQALVAVTV